MSYVVSHVGTSRTENDGTVRLTLDLEGRSIGLFWVGGSVGVYRRRHRDHCRPP